MNITLSRFLPEECAVCKQHVVHATTGTRDIDVLPFEEVGGTVRLTDTGGTRPLATVVRPQDVGKYRWGSLHKPHVCPKQRRGVTKR